MKLGPLTTYLRTYRKRTGLTHEEMAFLCGSMAGTSVTRHENSKRLPLLRTALMYELILRVPVRAIYEGIFFETAAIVRRRAKGLCASLESKPRSKARDYKIAHLKRVIEDLAVSP